MISGEGWSVVTGSSDVFVVKSSDQSKILKMTGKIKLRMEMGNVPKRQQPDHRKKKQQQKVTNRSSM